MKQFIFLLVVIFLFGCTTRKETKDVPKNSTVFLFKNNEKDYKSIDWLNTKKVNDSKYETTYKTKQYGYFPGTLHEVPESYIIVVKNDIDITNVCFEIKNKNNNMYFINVEIAYLIDKVNASKFVFNLKSKEEFTKKINNELNNKLINEISRFNDNEIYLINDSLSEYIFKYIKNNYQQFGIDIKNVQVKSTKNLSNFNFEDFDLFF